MWISLTYGVRTSDAFIVQDLVFLDLLEPEDQVIADRGLKIKTNLVMKQCKLSIPPNPAKGNQMTSSDTKKT